MPHPPTQDAPAPVSYLHTGLRLSPKALCPLPSHEALPSLPAFSFSQSRHLLKSSCVLLRLGFSLSRSGHCLYLRAGVLGGCRDLGDRAAVGGDLQGATVLWGMIPFHSQSSRKKIHLPGEMTQQEEDIQPEGTSHARSTCNAAGQP